MVRKTVEKVQKLSTIIMSGSIESSPQAALEVLLILQTLGQIIKETAANIFQEMKKMEGAAP